METLHLQVNFLFSLFSLDILLMEKMTNAEKNHLFMENASLKKQLQQLLSRNSLPEYEDLIAALTISEIQRERLSFLQKELDYVNERKRNLREEEKKNQKIKSIESCNDLELRLELAKKRKSQLESDIQNIEKKSGRELAEIKLHSARQNASLLSNL